MEQRVSLVTLGVRDLVRARKFYEALGWRTRAEPGDDVVFFQAGGLVLALWDRAALAEDSGVEDAGGWGGVTLAHNVRSPAEVDAIATEARAGRDVLGRLLGGDGRSRGPRLGDRAQPALDDPRRRLCRAAGLATRPA
jgi:catechol 2,3-dioxygenase-like lactoylglutathione lyase family enzyme